MQKESGRISSEMAQLRQDQLRVRTEGETIAKERDRLEKLAKEVEGRSQEAEKLHQVHLFVDYLVLVIIGVYSIALLLVCASYEGERRAIAS